MLQKKIIIASLVLLLLIVLSTLVVAVFQPKMHKAIILQKIIIKRDVK